MPTKNPPSRASGTPIYVIAGFLGSGKTTLLKRALAYELDQGVTPAVLMNEFGEVDVDGALLHEHPRSQDVELQSLLSGCICCDLSGEFTDKVGHLMKETQGAPLFIETTGLADTGQVVAGVHTALAAQDSPSLGWKATSTSIYGGGRDHAHGMEKKTGMLVLIGDAVHNTADGIAIGAACVASPGLGLVTTLAVLGHEVPQELSDFTILLSSGFTRWKAFLWNSLSGLGTLAGVVAAYGGLGYAEAIVPYALSVAAASFMYIGLADLVPGLHGRMGAAKGVWQFAMMIAGMATIATLTMLPH